MGTKINLVGQRFGRLTVKQDSGKRTGCGRHGDGHVIWGCRCDCGKWINVISGNLRYGHTKSCGCLKREQMKALGNGRIKHGESKNSRLYVTWINLKRKGRGIRICKEWLDKKTGYLSFRQWAMANGFTVRLRYYRISRKDKRKNFSPDNCEITSRVGVWS